MTYFSACGGSINGNDAILEWSHLMAKMDAVNVGIVGCGTISGIYLENAKRFKNLDIIACADLDFDRAKQKASEHGIPKALTVEHLLADPDVEIVLNLTVPKAHAEVSMASLEAGKHVYGEKPLTVNRQEAQSIVNLARKKNLRIGCAPDTFFGAAHQTCRHLIDQGAIGEPVAATAFMLCHGHESWHPAPAFYYEIGGGPLLDMGPYYITALVNLMGGVRRVSGSARITFPERIITSEAKRGQSITVETPTHVAGILDFTSGAIATLVTSFDVWDHTHTPIEIYGTEGSLIVPDPNVFGGIVKQRRRGEPAWAEVVHTHRFESNSRGVGLSDMASAIRTGRVPRASGDLAYHALDIMLSILESSEVGRHITLTSAVDRPAALPIGPPDDEIPE
jgi:predicted dehydrogenase